MADKRKSQISGAFLGLNRRMRELEVSAGKLTKTWSVSQLKGPSFVLGVAKVAAKALAVSTVVFVLCFCFVHEFHWPISRATMFVYLRYITLQGVMTYNCLLPLDGITLQTIRTPLYCDFCKGVDHIEEVRNMTPELFIERYAYTGRPVIVKGAQNTTTEDGGKMDFAFLKSLYPADSPSLKNIHRLCEFQLKVGSFETLGDMFNMSVEMQNAGADSTDRWYAGWINCDREVTERYTELFLPPYLPTKSAMSRTMWTFMGSPNLGYTMHIDPVHRPQWHTQLFGTKKWYVEPPSECYFECGGHRTMEVVAEPGDTILFHNGMWYHMTENIGDTISIAVAAEFD